MSDIAIKVQGLGKEYRIGKREKYKTVRETLMSFVTAPFRRNHKVEGEEGSETFWALKDVSFEVNRGEVVGIIGRNGAGKSTLLKILSRITDPTEGVVEIDGRVGSLLEVGTGFHPELTGRENVYLNGAILGMRRGEIQRKFDEIVAFSEIEKFLDTPVKHYSSGMYMRLAFAVAAHLEPEILIVDEVLAVGDMSFQKKCLGKIGEVAREGRTVLFVSHNLNAVVDLCNRAIILHHGSVSFSGDATSAAAEYVRRLRTNSIDRRAVNSAGFGVLSARVAPEGEDAAVDEPTFTGDMNIVLEFECRLPESTALNLGMTICSHDRDLPAMSASVRDSGITLPSGHQFVRVIVAAGRLPSGSYRVEAAVVDATSVIAQSDNLVFFHVVNDLHNKLGTVPRAGALLGMPWQISPAAASSGAKSQVR